MILQLDKRFKKNVRGRFGKYEFQVGVLGPPKPYKEPRRGERGKKGRDVITQYAGGPIRKKSRRNSGLTIQQVSEENRRRYDYLREPFEKKSSDIIRFTNEFFKLAFGRSERRRAENLLQAVVRNPILRGDYGPNAPLTRKIKGFDRAMMDTAQLFKSITAVCKVRKN